MYIMIWNGECSVEVKRVWSQRTQTLESKGFYRRYDTDHYKDTFCCTRHPCNTSLGRPIDRSLEVAVVLGTCENRCALALATCKKSLANALNVDVLNTALALSRRVILLSVGGGLDVRGAVVGGSRRGGGSGRGDRSGRLRAGRRAGGSSRGGRRSSTVPDLRTREGEVLSTVVDAEVGVGVLVAVCGRELDHGAGSAVATVGHLDLNARDVVLRLVDVGPVDTTAGFELVALQ